MISIEQKGEIRRLFYVQHMTINAIALHVKIHHETVRRAIGSERFRNKRHRVSILDEWREYIDETLRLHPRIRAPRMAELLYDRGYKGSISSVRAHLRTLRKRIGQPYLRLENFPSEQGQVDWAAFGKVEVEGGLRRLSCFVMVLSYSRAIFARFTYDQTLESFLSCHMDAFKRFGGVPRNLLYDNLKSAVIERYGDQIRFNESLLELAAHYRFAPKACQPYAGNQKGRVERAIRYLRDGFFEARRFSDLEDLNNQLDEWIKKVADIRPWPQNRDRRVHEAFAEEQGSLIPLASDGFDPSRIVITRSGKQPYLRFDGNHYSIPHEFVGQALTLRAYPDRIAIYEKDKFLAVHVRSFARGRYIDNPTHIEALYDYKKTHRQYRNRSVMTTCLPEAEPLLKMWNERGDNLGRNAQRIIELTNNYGQDAVREAVLHAIRENIPSPDSIGHILMAKHKSIQRLISPRLPAHLHDFDIKSHDPSQYDLLTDAFERKSNDASHE